MQLEKGAKFWKGVVKGSVIVTLVVSVAVTVTIRQVLGSRLDLGVHGPLVILVSVLLSGVLDQDTQVLEDKDKLLSFVSAQPVALQHGYLCGQLP